MARECGTSDVSICCGEKPWLRYVGPASDNLTFHYNFIWCVRGYNYRLLKAQSRVQFQISRCAVVAWCEIVIGFSENTWIFLLNIVLTMSRARYLMRTAWWRYDSLEPQAVAGSLSIPWIITWINMGSRWIIGIVFSRESRIARRITFFCDS